jgi:hypothetical protein
MKLSPAGDLSGGQVLSGQRVSSGLWDLIGYDLSPARDSNGRRDLSG